MENCKGCTPAIRSWRYPHWRGYVSRFGGSIARSGDLKGIAAMLFRSADIQADGEERDARFGVWQAAQHGTDPIPPP